MATRSKMKPKSMAAAVRSATAIASDIVDGLKGLGTAKETIGKVYREAAETLHGICSTFTEVQWNRCKSEESTKSAYTAAGMDAATFAKVAEFRKTILDAVKAFNESEAKIVWQNICRWSPSYTGSKPNHPDAIAKAKAEAGTKAGTKADKTEAETETETVSVSDQVEKTPQFARIVISQVIGGLTARMGMMKKEKLSVANVKAAIDALGEAAEYIALMK